MYCEDRKTFQCYPSFSTIGNHIGKTKNSVKKYVDGLRDKGLISTQTTKKIAKDGAVLNGNLLYTILPIQNGIDVYNETQLYLAQLEWEQQKILRLAEKRGVNIKAG